MKKQVRVSLILTVMLSALGLIITGCDIGGDGATNKITGVVRDSASGELVAAVTVSFGSSSTTTGADGSYSLDLGASSGVVTGAFSVYGSGYTSRYVEQVPVDASQSTTWSPLGSSRRRSLAETSTACCRAWAPPINPSSSPTSPPPSTNAGCRICSPGTR